MYSPQADGHLPVGFPHSEISGSKPVSGSPELIAAVHVLHRLWLPRHPPYALCSLTLSLRHASSRARDSTRESRIRCASLFVRPAPFACARVLGTCFVSLLLDDSIYSRRQELTSFSLFSFQRTVAGYPAGPRRPRRRGKSFCGADRDRTDDLRLAKPALSQLSYSPMVRGFSIDLGSWTANDSCGPGQS